MNRNEQNVTVQQDGRVHQNSKLALSLALSLALAFPAGYGGVRMARALWPATPASAVVEPAPDRRRTSDRLSEVNERLARIEAKLDLMLEQGRDHEQRLRRLEQRGR